jgi:hypothetical protein
MVPSVGIYSVLTKSVRFVDAKSILHPTPSPANGDIIVVGMGSEYPNAEDPPGKAWK